MSEKKSPLVAAVIPARYASSRFPGKPLIELAGKTMIERVYRQAQKAQRVRRVIVATDDERIAAAVNAFGGEVVMTSANHATGTDRLAQVAALNPEFEIIVNVQGDEPLIDPGAIDAVVEPLLASAAVQMSTTAFRLKTRAEGEIPQQVKVVVDRNGDALYFSRALLPFYRDESDFAKRRHLGHMGLYAYTRDCLLKLASLEQTPLEEAECLEQLRALENGIKIRVVEFEARSMAIDVPEDVAKVEKALQLLGV